MHDCDSLVEMVNFRSSKDPNTFQLSHHDDNALTRSFDELQLFSGHTAENDNAKLLKVLNKIVYFFIKLDVAFW